MKAQEAHQITQNHNPPFDEKYLITKVLTYIRLEAEAGETKTYYPIRFVGVHSILNQQPHQNDLQVKTKALFIKSELEKLGYKTSITKHGVDISWKKPLGERMKSILFAIAAFLGGGFPEEPSERFAKEAHRKADKMARRKARKAYKAEYRKWL